MELIMKQKILFLLLTISLGFASDSANDSLYGILAQENKEKEQEVKKKNKYDDEKYTKEGALKYLKQQKSKSKKGFFIKESKRDRIYRGENGYSVAEQGGRNIDPLGRSRDINPENKKSYSEAVFGYSSE